MSIFHQGFEIKVLPSSPTGFNQGVPAPRPELVSTAPIRIADPLNPGFMPWVAKLNAQNIVTRDPGAIGLVMLFSFLPLTVANGGQVGFNLNLTDPFFKQAINLLGGELPPHKTIQLHARARWEQIYQNYNQGATSALSRSVTKGVTSTKSQTSNWSVSVGLSVSAGFGPISATLSTSFSTGGSRTRSIALSESITEEETFTIRSNTYVQIWQLVMSYQSDTTGPVLEQKTSSFQTLTYPNMATTNSSNGRSSQSRMATVG